MCVAATSAGIDILRLFVKKKNQTPLRCWLPRKIFNKIRGNILTDIFFLWGGVE